MALFTRTGRELSNNFCNAKTTGTTFCCFTWNHGITGIIGATPVEWKLWNFVLKLLFQLIVDYFYSPVRAGFVTNLVRSFVRLMIWAMGLTWVFPLTKLHLSKSLLTQVFFGCAWGVFDCCGTAIHMNEVREL